MKKPREYGPEWEGYDIESPPKLCQVLGRQGVEDALMPAKTL